MRRPGNAAQANQALSRMATYVNHWSRLLGSTTPKTELYSGNQVTPTRHEFKLNQRWGLGVPFHRTAPLGPDLSEIRADSNTNKTRMQVDPKILLQ